jgi:hypothetical protein
VSSYIQVYLINPVTQKVIQSYEYEGDEPDLIVLENGNFIISDDAASFGGINNTGTVRLFDQDTGEQIGDTIAGDNENDVFKAIYSTDDNKLPSSHFVVYSYADDIGGIVDAGSVALYDGETGLQIGSTLQGDSQDDEVGRAIRILPNGNYVVLSYLENINGDLGAGTIRVFSGGTAAQVGSTIAGSNLSFIGKRSSVLDNGSNILVSWSENENGIRLINGDTGAQIGAVISEDTAGDVQAVNAQGLSNGNLVIGLALDDVGGLSNAGSVRLINGVTGAQVGSLIVGDNDNDRVGYNVTPLTNGNYIAGSQRDVIGGLSDVGSVSLYNGSTGAKIGASVSGSYAGDFVGAVAALGNGNYVVYSSSANIGGINNTGYLALFDGVTAAQIGTSYVGDVDEQIGYAVRVLSNNKFIIGSPYDDVDGVNEAGSVMLVDGTTGAQIGSTYGGDNAFDRISNANLGETTPGFYYVSSRLDNVNDISDAGSVSIFDASTGLKLGDGVAGDAMDDSLGDGGEVIAFDDNLILLKNQSDNSGAGSIMFIDGSTGNQVGSTINGVQAYDLQSVEYARSADGSFIVLGLYTLNIEGEDEAGKIMVIPTSFYEPSSAL